MKMEKEFGKFADSVGFTNMHFGRVRMIMKFQKQRVDPCKEF